MNLNQSIRLHCGVSPTAKQVDVGGHDEDPEVPKATKLPFGHRVYKGRLQKKDQEDKFFQNSERPVKQLASGRKRPPKPRQRKRNFRMA